MVRGVRILGIDPGLASTGYGVIDHLGQSSRLVASGCITTAAGEPLAGRLKHIHDSLAGVITEFQPEAVSIEMIFFCNNARTIIGVSQARGVAILATANANLPLFEYTPLQIKQAVAGYGKATKQQVEKMVRALLGNGAGAPSTSHAADALAAALCYAHSHRMSQMVQAALAAGKR